MHLKMSLSFPLPLSFAFPSAQDEVDQSASVEDLEKQIEKLAKVNITVAGLTGNQTESCDRSQGFGHISQINWINFVSSTKIVVQNLL